MRTVTSLTNTNFWILWEQMCQYLKKSTLLRKPLLLTIHIKSPIGKKFVGSYMANPWFQDKKYTAQGFTFHTATNLKKITTC